MHRWLRVALVYVAGVGLILFGIAGLVLPLHPGLVVIALGLGVLSLEAAWARRARQRFLVWLADRDVESERLRRWQRRLEDWMPDEGEEEPDASTPERDGDESRD